MLTDLKKLYYDEKKNIAKGFEPSIINKGYLKTDYAAAAAAAATAVSPPDIFFENDEIYSYRCNSDGIGVHFFIHSRVH